MSIMICTTEQLPQLSLEDLMDTFDYLLDHTPETKDIDAPEWGEWASTGDSFIKEIVRRREADWAIDVSTDCATADYIGDLEQKVKQLEEQANIDSETIYRQNARIVHLENRLTEYQTVWRPS